MKFAGWLASQLDQYDEAGDGEERRQWSGVRWEASLEINER